MKKNIFLLLTAFLGFQCYSQVNGYLGRRLFLSVHGGLSPSYRTQLCYYGDDKALNVQTPIGADITFVANNKFSLGASVVKTSAKGAFSDILDKRQAYYDYTATRIYYSGRVNISANIFNVYLEGHRMFSYSVIDNYFRFGFTYASIKNKSYDYTVVYPSNAGAYYRDIPDSIYPLQLNQKTSMIGLYYEIGNRVPLSDHLLFFYGISGNLYPQRNLVYVRYNSMNIGVTKGDQFMKDLCKKRISNTTFFNLNFGLNWAF